MADYLQKCGKCSFEAVLPSSSFCPTCDTKMLSRLSFNSGAPMDQCVCLQCGHRVISRHNPYCSSCGVVMVYERAWAEIEALRKYAPPPEVVESKQEEAPTQLGLFGVA